MNNQQKSILVVSATEDECKPILQKIERLKTINSTSGHCLFSGIFNGQSIEILITGIGAVATTFRLTQTLMQRTYDRVFSIGIAGSFSNEIPIGETVQIVEDCFADLGIDDNGQFRTLDEEGLSNDDFDKSFLINNFIIKSPHSKLRGITVQTTSGSEKRIAEMIERYHPDVETMENAAFFYVCRKMQIPFASFRAISNKIEARNRKKWRIKEAIDNVNENLSALILLYIDSLSFSYNSV